MPRVREHLDLHARLDGLGILAGYLRRAERLVGDGYRLGAPSPRALLIDVHAMATVTCSRCRHAGLFGVGYVRERSYRVLGLCPVCGMTVEG